MGLHQSVPDPQVILRNVDTDDTLRYTGASGSTDQFCLACHDEDGVNGDITPFTDDIQVPVIDAALWNGAAHKTGGVTNNGYGCMGDGVTTGCHGNGHGSEKRFLLMPDQTAAAAPLYESEEEGFCYNCHDGSPVVNMAISGNVNNIQQAFAQGRHHPVRDNENGHIFTINGANFELECTTCHNPHTVTGRHSDAAEGLTSVTRPDLSQPERNPVAMGNLPWGDDPAEKISQFAARGSGSGGWYYSIARGRRIVFDRSAVYQPPVVGGGGLHFEFGEDVLPDYATFCLDCHTYRMGTHPPVNWGQPGVQPTGNAVDPPDQRIEAGAQHGLGSANKPSFWGDQGLFGNSGNPDPIFNVANVPRGRGAGHFMRWPYESASRNAGINFVMSCTDCHEAHGSGIGSMLRQQVNNGPGSTIWNTMCNNCHYYYGGNHAGMSCGSASCHEANSIHRIIHNTASGGTFLWTEPSQPTTTPEIQSVIGVIGENSLTVTFTDSVYTEVGASGSLNASDFVFTDTDNNNARSIISLEHQAGSLEAVLTFNRAIQPADVFRDLIATSGMNVFGAHSSLDAPLPAGPWPLTIVAYPEAGTLFEFNEQAAAATIADSTGLISGTVNDPVQTITGDGFYHGDGQNNYISFTSEYHNALYKATRKLTIETRIKPSVVDNGAVSTIQRIFLKNGNNYQISVWRNLDTLWSPTFHPPAGVAVLAFWLRVVDTHGGDAWKVVMTDYSSYPIVAGHWYSVRMIWDSDRQGGIPCRIFVDDEGTDGNGANQNWDGMVDGTDADQSQVIAVKRLFEGDRILSQNSSMYIGATSTGTLVFNGLIDRIRLRIP
jgi:hypothetical protein